MTAQSNDRPSRRRLLKALASLPFLSGLGVSQARPGTESQSAKSPASPPRIAVVGAGAFGGWTAMELLRRGAAVTLIDAWGPGNSRASSGGETRVIRSVYGPDRVYVEMVSRSFQLWRDAEHRWQRRLYKRTGALWMFQDDDLYLRQSRPLLDELKIPLEELSLSETRRRWPQIDWNGIRKAYFEPESGFLSARRACRLLVKNFVDEGGIYRRSAVRPGDIRSGKMGALRLSDGSSLPADRYVFACGPWLGRLFPQVIGDAIQPTRQEVFYFGTPFGSEVFSEKGLPIWIDFGEKVYYGIPGAGHRGFKVADDTRGAPFDPTSGDRTPSRLGTENARRFLARRFPGMARAPLLEARVCQYANSPDGDLIADRHPEASNSWILGGGSGHGFKLSPALGEHAAKRILEDAPAIERFSISRQAGSGGRRTQFRRNR